MGKRQLEYIIDIIKTSGLALASFGLADLAIGTGRTALDVASLIVGISALAFGFYLTGKLEDGNL